MRDLTIFYDRRFAICWMVVCWCALAPVTAWAQSATRSTAAPIANRGRSTGTSSPTLVAEPKPQGANPFSPPVTRNLRLPVAVGGFCVVSLRENQQWLLGSERSQLNFDGRLYWFVSQRERAMFAAAPQRYVPSLGGDCVVTLADEGIRARGNPQYGILHNQKLFFFRSVAEQEKFRTEPGRYAQADLANAGQCVVSQIDQERQLPGLPETTVIVNGIRYLFAGVDQQRKFLLDMRHYGVQPATVARAENTAMGPPPLLTPEAFVPSNKKPDQTASKPLPKTTKPLGLANKAMNGYCPVSIRDAGLWLLGDENYQVRVDGLTYFLAGEAEQKRFSTSPNTYLPALGGKCVVSEIDENKLVPGSIFHAAQYEDRLYLFAGARQKQVFKSSPATYMNADLAANGNCVVSLIDEGREIAGLPELLIWHRGKRYLFASPELQAKFRENIQRYQQR